jgi:hypothetical protein
LLGSPSSSIFNLISIKVFYGLLKVPEWLILAGGAVASLLAMIILWKFDEKLDLSNMRARGLVVYGDPSKLGGNQLKTMKS